MGQDQEIDTLRVQIREVTDRIMRDVQKRMEFALKVGEIKNKKGVEVRDEKVEQDIRNMVLSISREIGMNPDFALRLLNVLLEESEIVQMRRRHQLPKQTHLGIFMKARQLEASGKEMIHLEVGEPDYPPPLAVEKSLSESFRLKRYHYTETRGIATLREALSQREGVPEERLIITPGGRFAVFSAIASLLRPGHELITIEPAWPAYKECADFVGAKTRVLRARFEDNWSPDLARLEEMISPATKMIVLNYPNNPTGKILDTQTMEKILDIAKDNDIYLLSDEVYADYTFGKPFESTLAFEYDKTIMVSSFSKRYAMTGFRVGYGIAQREVIEKMNKVQAVGITSVAEPMQYSALAAMGEGFENNVAIMKARIHYVCSKLEEMSLRFVRPDGAMYVFPELKQVGDIELVEKLLDKGVAVAPGSGFGDTYGNYIRVSACQPIEILRKGLDLISSVLKESN